MRKFIFIMLVLLPFFVSAQAYLGANISEIKDSYPDNKWEVNYTNDGTKYIRTDMPLGLFTYFFENGLTTLCIQFPHSLSCLNTQVEIYNKKYVITSKTSWTAYLEGGGMMNINLNYNEDRGYYCFYYSNAN